MKQIHSNAVDPTSGECSSDLDYHMRQVRRIIGEQMIANHTYGVHITTEDIRAFVYKLKMEERLISYLEGMFGLENGATPNSSSTTGPNPK